MQSVSSLLLAGPSPSSPEAAETTPPPMQPLQCQHERLVGNMCPSLYLAVYRGRIAEVTALLLEQPAVAIDCQATATPGIKGNNLFILCFRVHIHLYTEINDARSFLKKKTEDWKKLIRNAFLTGATPLARLTISFSN